MYDTFRTLLAMGFKDARSRAIEALKSGDFEHATRADIDDKNLLFTGEVTVSKLIELLKGCRGNQYEVSPHHQVASVDVHIFKPQAKEPDGTKVGWYIKLYFIDPDTWFISVHRS